MYNAEYGYYPSSLDENNCPLTPTPDIRYCLKASGDTVLVYTGGGQSFILTASRNGIYYETTESLSPYSTTKTAITAIAAISGTVQVGQTLSAGAITPDSATVTYQWKSASSSGGTYTNIPSATLSTYLIAPTEANKYFKLTVTGIGGYINTQTSIATSSAATTPITAIAAITGTLQISQTLTAGAITPAAATATYQWKSATTVVGTYTNIAGATGSSYIVSPNNMNKYLKVIVSGTGDYAGVQTSVASVIANDANWLAVGTQTWAKANLNVGTMVTGVTEQTNNSVLEKYCYSNTEANCTTYGALYQWNEAMQYSTTEGSKGACPLGAHVPSDNDWKILEIQLGMTQAQADALNQRGTDQGTQLKPGGSSGLNLQLSGNRSAGGPFYNQAANGYIWSSSESSASAQARFLSAVATVYRNTYDKGFGFSVRCVGN